MNKISDNIIWTLKLYTLTLVLPISLSIINVLFCGILGVETKFDFLTNFKIIWIDYYFTGSFNGVESWKIHLGILFLLFMFTIFNDE